VCKNAKAEERFTQKRKEDKAIRYQKRGLALRLCVRFASCRSLGFHVGISHLLSFRHNQEGIYPQLTQIQGKDALAHV
jgi:hypothetical protein